MASMHSRDRRVSMHSQVSARAPDGVENVAILPVDGVAGAWPPPLRPLQPRPC